MPYQHNFRSLARLRWSLTKRQHMSPLLALLLVVMAALLLEGCVASSNSTANSFASDQANSGGTAPASVQAAAFSSGGTSGSYRIGPFDVLDITVFQVPELTKSVQVGDNGIINLPLVGEVNVGGKTPNEVERDLTAKLGADYLQNPQVSVYVKEYNSQSVTISGAVNKPGLYPIKGKTSLMQAIALAGDLKPDSDSSILVLRQNDGKRMAGRFDLGNIQNGRAEDPTLQAGDQIVAGSSAIKKGFNAILRALPLIGTFALL
jgi:polysaccharide export outer membrane protein